MADWRDYTFLRSRHKRFDPPGPRKGPPDWYVLAGIVMVIVAWVTMIVLVYR